MGRLTIFEVRAKTIRRGGFQPPNPPLFSYVTLNILAALLKKYSYAQKYFN